MDTNCIVPELEHLSASKKETANVGMLLLPAGMSEFSMMTRVFLRRNNQITFQVPECGSRCETNTNQDLQ
jgi:hypothetical protein